MEILSMILLLLNLSQQIYGQSFTKTELNIIHNLVKYKSISSLIFGRSDSFSHSIFLTNYFSKLGVKVKVIGSDEYWQYMKDDFNIFVLKDSDAYFDNYLRYASYKDLFGFKQNWIIFSQNRTNVTNWSTVELQIDSEVLLIEPTNRTNFDIISVYNTGYNFGGTLLKRKVGYIQNHGLNLVMVEYLKYDLRSNLHGINIKTSAVVIGHLKNQDFISYLNDEHGDSIDSETRKYIWIANLLSSGFNFTWTTLRVNEWGGYKKVNGSTTGQIGLLHRGEVEVGITALFFERERWKYLDYGAEVGLQRSIIIFRQPDQMTGSSTKAFLKPLSWDVWYDTLWILFIAVLMLGMIKFVENMFIRYGEEHGQLDIIDFLVGVIMQQGVAMLPRLESSRINLLVLIVFSFLLNQFYSASIVSELLGDAPTPIKTTRDLLESNFQFYIEDGVIYHKSYFQTTQNDVAVSIYQKKCFGGTRSQTFVSLDKGIELVLKGGAAFYGESDSIYPKLRGLNMKTTCQISELVFDKKKVTGHAFKKGSHFKELFTFAMRKMHERGVIRQSFKKSHGHLPNCDSSLSDTTVAVGIEQTTALFIMLLLFTFVAAIILAIEIFVYRARYFIHQKWKALETIESA